MDYKLAKKIKDAGFPQENRGYWIKKDGSQCLKLEINGIMPSIDDGEVRSPTLSELIEECGIKFNHLSKYEGNSNYYWVALASNGKKSEGVNPEEAVANLWLMLNEK